MNYYFLMFEDAVYDIVYFGIIWDHSKMEISRAFYNRALDQIKSSRELEIAPEDTADVEPYSIVNLKINSPFGEEESLVTRLVVRAYNDSRATNIIAQSLKGFLTEMSPDKLESIGLSQIIGELIELNQPKG